MLITLLFINELPDFLEHVDNYSYAENFRAILLDQTSKMQPKINIANRLPN